MQLHNVFDLVIHLDKHIHLWADQLGAWIYIVIFLIIFFETGLIVTPFLPGDSLLFAVGAMTAGENASLNYWVIVALLAAAAIFGAIFNYALGRYFGPKIFQKENSIWFNRSHLIKTQAFYERHGGKAVVIARFFPIFRTFVPFVAGIGRMQYSRFLVFNVVGGIGWVFLMVSAGHFFGNLPWIRRNFGLVIPLIVIVSCLPIAWKFISDRLHSRKSSKGPAI